MPSPNDPTIKDMEDFDEGNHTNLYMIRILEKEIDYKRYVY